MAELQALGDALLQLRQAISRQALPVTTTTASLDTATTDLAQATFLSFPSSALQDANGANSTTIASYPLDAASRFVSSGEPVNLRSIYFAWQHKDDPIPEYLAAAETLNAALAETWAALSDADRATRTALAQSTSTSSTSASNSASAPTVRHLGFVERLDLITWLEGASEDSEYIAPLTGDAVGAGAASGQHLAPGAAGSATAIAEGGAGAVAKGIDVQNISGVAVDPSATALGTGAAAAAAAATTTSTSTSRTGKTLDPRLQLIYKHERRMGDRQTMLRGIKQTEYSHVRKSAEVYLKAARQAARAGASGNTGPTALASHPKTSSSSSGSSSGKPGRRPDPIILLSPSASSLLRMSNIKAFLSDGTYQPPDNSLASATTNILHISRLLPGIDASRPLRFILVDSPDQFKPDYWARVVAVFTTGQAWQFKAYKWQTPQELFGHVLGIYVGWRDDRVPDAVRSWGRGVVSLGVEKWRGEGVGRWRDREVVEGLWSRIEERMKVTGWDSGGPQGR